MAKGLPSNIAKQYGISKKGWSVWRSQQGKKGSKRKMPTKYNLSARKAPTRATFRGAYRRIRSSSLPLSIVIPAVAPMVFSVMEQADKFKSGDYVGGITETLYSMGVRYTGYNMRDQKWYPNYLVNTYLPILAGILIHKFLGKRVNPYMKRIPMLGQYVSL